MIPIKGMIKEPYGFPLMMDAWIGCIHWAIGNDDILRAFQKESGINLRALLPRSPIEAMVDEATGFSKHGKKDLILKFCDWVTENIWGLEDSNPTQDIP